MSPKAYGLSEKPVTRISMACFGFFIPFSANSWCVSAPLGARTNNQEVANKDLFCLESLAETVYEESFDSGLTVRISRDGLVLLRFLNVPGYLEAPEVMSKPKSPQQDNANAHIKFRAPYAEAMNAFLACLSGTLKRTEYPLNLGHIATNQVQEAKNDFSLGVTRSIKTGNHIEARFPYGYHFPPHGDSRNFRTNLIELDTLKSAAANLNLLVREKSETAIKLAAMFTLSVSSYEEHDFSRSLITSWAIIENILNSLWKALMRESNPPIQGKRKEKWNGSNFTISIKIEMLSMAGMLSEAEYGLVDKARVDRNNWIHALADVTFNSAHSSCFAASVLFQRVYNVPLAKEFCAWL